MLTQSKDGIGNEERQTPSSSIPRQMENEILVVRFSRVVVQKGDIQVGRLLKE